MVNRVATLSNYNSLLSYMNTSSVNYNRLTAQIASGCKVTSINDDPIAAVNIINTNRQLGNIETFTQNVGTASAELGALDDLMELANGYLSTAWNKALQANQQTYGHNSLTALKTEVDEIIKTMVDLANTEYNDNYIFAGANTKSMPYEILENGDVVYTGTTHDNPDYIRQTEVADGVFEVINTTGDKVFGYYKSEVEAGQGVYTDTATKKRVLMTDEDGNRIYPADDGAGNTIYKYTKDDSVYTGNVVYRYENGVEYDGNPATDLEDGAKEEIVGAMGTLKLLSNSIQMVLDAKNDKDEDAEVKGYELMTSTLDLFRDAVNTIATEQTKFGGVANRLDMSESTLGTVSDKLTEYLSNVQDIDYATAITEWLNAQYAYQASLQVSSRAMNLSLLNYI